MANLEVLALDTAVPQIRAPGAGDGYSVPRDMTFASGTVLSAPTVDATNVEVTNVKAKDGTAAIVISDTSGNVGIGGTAGAANKTQILGTLPTSGAVSRAYASTADIPSSTTTAAINFSSAFNTSAASFTLTDMIHFNATQPTLGAGSTVTNLYGFAVQSSMALGTNNYGFYSNIASGTNRFNFYANGTADNYFAGNVGIGTASPAAKLDIGSGNLTFSSTGQRITGDFSNATQSNRLSFQSSTTNGNTAVHALPNGTSQTSAFNVLNNSDPTNASLGQLQITSTEVRINSSITGTGTQLPMIFAVGGERMRLDTSGNLGIGTASPFTTLDVNGYFTAGVRNTTNISLTSGTHYFGSSPSDLLRNNIVGNINTDSTTPVRLRFYKSRGTSASPTAVSSGDQTNDIQTYAYDGSSFIQATSIQAVVTATPSTNNVSSALSFSTNGGSSSPTERMRIDSSGNVGIGTASPGTKLDVVVSTNNGLRISDGAVTGVVYASSGPAMVVGTTSNHPTVLYSNNAERMRITTDGEIYIAGTTDQGAYNLQCNGTGVWGAGAYVNGSDARLKDNIQSLDAGLDVVKAMRPVTFQYKPDYSKDQSVQPGFIAQELQTAMAGKAYLEGVVQEGPNHLNVAYQNIIPILVKAIQELEAKVAALEAK
jgi:hypothetical protein